MNLISIASANNKTRKILKSKKDIEKMLSSRTAIGQCQEPFFALSMDNATGYQDNGRIELFLKALSKLINS